MATTTTEFKTLAQIVISKDPTLIVRPTLMVGQEVPFHIDVRLFYRKPGVTAPNAPVFPSKKGLMLNLDQARLLAETLTLVLADHENGKYDAVGATYI